MAGRIRAPGPTTRPGVARTETRLRGIPTCHGQDKSKVKPEFSTLNRPDCTSQPRAAICAGSQIAGRAVGRDPGIPKSHRAGFAGLDRRGRNVASPSCTSVGVVKLGRGGSTAPGCHARDRSVSELRRRVPASCPFLRGPPSAKSERRSTPPVIPVSPLGLRSKPESLRLRDCKATMRNNHAYGISCLTRPIPIVGNKVPNLETGTAWAGFSTPRTTRVSH